MSEFNDWGGDFSLYINQAQYFLNGDLNSLYDKQLFLLSYEKIGPYFYPMGVPLLISPIIHLFGVKFIYLKIYGWFFWLGSLYFNKKYLDVFFNNKKIIFVTLIFIQLTFSYLYILNSVLSDIYFLFFFNFLLYSLGVLNKHKWPFYLIGIIGFLTYIIRPTSVIIIGLTFFYLTFKYYKTKSFNYILPIIFFIILKNVYNLFFPFDFSSNETEYVLENISLNSIIKNSLIYFDYLLTYFFDIIHYFFQFISITFPYQYLIYIKYPLYFTILLLIYNTSNFNFFLARIKNLASIHYFLIILIFSFLSFLIVVPITNGVRYLFPILPIITYIFFSNLNSNILRYIVLFKLFNFMILFLYNTQRDFAYSNDNEAKDCYDYINLNLENEIIIFEKPRVLNLFTNATSVPNNKETRKKFRYILINTDLGNGNFTDQILDLKKPIIIFSNTKFKLYKLR